MNRDTLLPVAAVSVSFLLLYGKTIRKIVLADAAPPLVDFNAERPNALRTIKENFLVRGFEGIRDGLAVIHAKPGGVFSFAFNGGPGYLTAHLSAGAETGQKLRVLLEREHEPPVTLEDPWSFHHQDIDLTPFIKSGRTYRLTLRSRGPKGRHFLVQEFAIRRTSGVSSFPPVDSFLAGLAALIFLGRLKPRRRSDLPKRRAATYTVAAALILSFLRPEFLSQPWLWVSVLAGCILAERRYSTKKPPLTWEWLALILIAGFVYRWRYLGGAVGQPLEGDAPQYFQYAKHFHWLEPFSFGKREPFLIWINVCLGAVFGFHPFLARSTSLVFSMANVALCYAFILALCHRPLAAAAGSSLLSLGQFYVWNSTRGERAELYVLLLLAFFLILTSSRLRPVRKAGAAAVFSIMVSLTWLIGALTCFLSYAFHFLAAEKKRRTKAALIFFGLFAAGMVPFFIHHALVHKDPFYSINAATRYYKNVREGKSPSSPGGKENMAKYLLFEEGPKTAIDAAKGYVDIFLNPFYAMNSLFLGFTNRWSLAAYPFLIIGIGVCFLKREWTVFVFLFATLTLSPALIHNVFDPRLFLQAGPFVAFFFGRGVDASASFVRQAIEKKHA